MHEIAERLMLRRGAARAQNGLVVQRDVGVGGNHLRHLAHRQVTAPS